MKLPLFDSKGNSQGDIELGFDLIENDRGEQAVHDVVVAHSAAQRLGTACTKTMGEVAGTGKKPWRQKGTGRARAGSYQSPLWRGGGVTFGPKPRDFAKKVNAKVKTLALKKALSERVKAGDVFVVQDFKLESHKTKDFLLALKALKVAARTVLIVSERNVNLLLGSRNVADVTVTSGERLNTYEALLCDKMIFTKSAFEIVGHRLSAK